LTYAKGLSQNLHFHIFGDHVHSVFENLYILEIVHETIYVSSLGIKNTFYLSRLVLNYLIFFVTRFFATPRFLPCEFSKLYFTLAVEKNILKI
jgi:hypothetical protein